jgi:excisionase family DNA binding protein
MKIIGTTEAGRRLGISDARVRALIMSGRLKAVKVGGAWLIDPKDLAAVRDRKVGRPRSRKTKGKPKSKSGESR